MLSASIRRTRQHKQMESELGVDAVLRSGKRVAVVSPSTVLSEASAVFSVEGDPLVGATPIAEQQRDDAATEMMAELHSAQRLEADEARRAAGLVAQQQITIIRNELEQIQPHSHLSLSAQAPSAQTSPRFTAPNSRMASSRAIPCSTPPHGRRTAQQHARTTSSMALLAPVSPKMDSLPMLLSNTSSFSHRSPHIPPAPSSRSNVTPLHMRNDFTKASGRSTQSPKLVASPASWRPLYDGGRLLPASETIKIGGNGGDQPTPVDEPLVPPTMTPMTFEESHFQSVIHWAHMSFGEAVVAATGRSDGQQKPEGIEINVEKPNRLMTTACCGIIDQVMCHVPGLANVWANLRPYLFCAAFHLTSDDVKAMSHAASGEPVDRLNTTGEWIARKCAKRPMWSEQFDAAHHANEILTVKLKQSRESIQKHDRIFDVAARTADRALVSRCFYGWHDVTRHHIEHAVTLEHVLCRLQRRPTLLATFHAWRRLVLQNRLKLSKDKEANRHAVQEAKLKAKAQELQQLQKHLEVETERLRAQAEKEARQRTALLTSHEVEVRELQSVQESKDRVILSLEKIAKRWERVAKSFRPRHLMRFGPPPEKVFTVGKELFALETEFLQKGPASYRMSRSREQLEQMLVVWANSILDSSRSRARFTNLTHDFRDGHAITALCKCLIALHQAMNTTITGKQGTGAATTDLLIKAVPFNPVTRSSFAAPIARSGSVAFTSVPSSDGEPLPNDDSQSASSADGPLQIIHSLVVHTLYLGTSNGLFSPLISHCPFVSKILDRETFLTFAHPTAGIWIVASLFVQYIVSNLTTASQVIPSGVTVGDQRRRRSSFGVFSGDGAASGSVTLKEPATALLEAPGERHIVHVWEYALMMSQRSDRTAPYLPRRRSSAVRMPLQAVGGTVNSSAPIPPSLSSHSPDVAMSTNTSAVASPIRLSQRGSFAFSAGSATPSAASRRCSLQGVVSSILDDTQSDIEAYFGDHDDAEANHDDPVNHKSTSPTRAMIVNVSVEESDDDDENGDMKRSVSVPFFGEDSTAHSASPSPTESDLQHVERKLPPMPSDLHHLPLSTLVKQLLRDERVASAWVGLARVVSSLVLRFRVIDVDVAVSLPSGPVAPLRDSASLMQQRSLQLSHRVSVAPSPPSVAHLVKEFTEQPHAAATSLPRDALPRGSVVSVTAGTHRAGQTFFQSSSAPVKSPKPFGGSPLGPTPPPASPTQGVRRGTVTFNASAES